MDQRFLLRVAAIGLWLGMLMWPVTVQAEEVHIVQPGETLSQIARHQCRGATLVERSQQCQFCVGGAAIGFAGRRRIDGLPFRK